MSPTIALVVALLSALTFFGLGLYIGFLAGGSSARFAPALSLPGSALYEARVLNEFRRTTEELTRQLRIHEERVARDMAALMRLAAADGPPLDKSAFLRLARASQDFEQQLHSLATEAYAVQQRFAGVERAAADRNGEILTRGLARREQYQACLEPASPIGMQVREERRRETRHPFYCRQWIAPYNGCRIPEPEEFFCVQCRDISSSGISFFLDHEPRYQMVVVRLSDPDRPKYLTARIQRLASSSNSEFGQYVAGCQFLGTIHCDALPENLDASIGRREKQWLKSAAEAPF